METLKMDWVRKLTSRKFWTMLAGFITLLMTARGMSNGSVEQVVSIIMAGGAIIAYIFAEAWTDAAYAPKDNSIQ
jgi:hypothetical protein